MKKELYTLVLAAALLSALLSVTARPGSDDRATKIVEELNGGVYTPWASPVWKPPQSWMESALFTLQAAAGAFIFGYGLHQIRRRNIE